ncbi:hypothetical protein JW935_03760 [candidate division KSB1 bacterium]|nr:hypothetical protein [candidate division KSB1 bacterium]
MKDLFGKETRKETVHVNIYADEVIDKKCPYTNHSWNYIGLILENIDSSLLTDIINERFIGNFDKDSKYYAMNNKIVHWCDMRTADTKNICKRWFEYILNPSKSADIFYSYILGLNNSLLARDEFGSEDEFNNMYNRFFRSAVLYALKCFFGHRQIIVENIYHEIGQQQHHSYFPWHSIYKLGSEKNITFKCDEIIFLAKDHKANEQANLVQLCDTILGASTSILHGVDKSKKSFYREELVDLYLPLFKRILENPKNTRSRFQYANRIMIRFFPKEKSAFGDMNRLKNQFYSNRPLYYHEEKSGQLKLAFF